MVREINHVTLNLLIIFNKNYINDRRLAWHLVKHDVQRNRKKKIMNRGFTKRFVLLH